EDTPWGGGIELRTLQVIITKTALLPDSGPLSDAQDSHNLVDSMHDRSDRDRLRNPMERGLASRWSAGGTARHGGRCLDWPGRGPRTAGSRTGSLASAGGWAACGWFSRDRADRRCDR